MVTHRALVTCTVLMVSLDEQHDPTALAIKGTWIEVLDGLHADPGLEQYWSSSESAESFGMWARLHVAVGNHIAAETAHGTAAAKFVAQGDVARATMELDEVRLWWHVYEYPGPKKKRKKRR